MEDDEEDEEDEEMEDDEEEEDPLELPSNPTILQNKRQHPLFSRLFRSKGEYWLATRPGRAGEWSQAGAMLTLAGGRARFGIKQSGIGREGGSEGIDELVRHDIEAGGKYGDRRQELVFIGENLDIKGIEAELDACLLNEEEWKVWEEVMGAGEGPNHRESMAEKEKLLQDVFDDGFPDWDDGEEEHDHMDHDHQGHGHVKRVDSHSPSRPAKAKHGVKKDGTVY